MVIPAIDRREYDDVPGGNSRRKRGKELWESPAL